MTEKEFLKAMQSDKVIYAINNNFVWYLIPQPIGVYVCMHIKVESTDYYQSLTNHLTRSAAYDIVKSLDIDWQIKED